MGCPEILWATVRDKVRARAIARIHSLAADPWPLAPSFSEERYAVTIALAHEELQRFRDVGLQLGPRHHRVQHAVLQQELAALETFRQLLPDRLLDHPGTGETDQRSGLRNVEIPQH